MNKIPKVYIVAGPNGAGKTTFAKKFLPFYADCFEFINADLIAAGISPLNFEKAVYQAGRLMLDQIFKLANKRSDFAFETTLSGKSYVRFLKQLKASGYEIHLFYLWIPDSRLALKRIAERTESGGHDIPKSIVIRRFRKSLKNFFKLYWSLPDTISLIDNSISAPRLIASKHGGNLHIMDESLFKRIRESR